MNTPFEVAKIYAAGGKKKVQLPLPRMLVLAIFAGIFIGIGGVCASAAGVGAEPASWGKLLGACIFPGGLTMVLLAGGELFTGNCLLAMSVLEKEITGMQMLRNWGVVYLGNFIGGILVAAACVYGHQFSLFEDGMAVAAMNTAVCKCTLPFSDALIKGIACTFLVCIAVWIALAATSVPGKIAGLFFPIMIFVMCGFEHCVANMYYIPAGIMAKGEYRAAAAAAGLRLSELTWGNFLLRNLLPVTLGNIIGGALLAGIGYWFIYLKRSKTSSEQ